MQEIKVGASWFISIMGEPREVKVIAAGDTPGWWKCIDLETGVEFLAREKWFVTPMEGTDG